MRLYSRRFLSDQFLRQVVHIVCPHSSVTTSLGRNTS